MSDYELLQRQLARARKEAEQGRIPPMEEWLGIISLSNTTDIVRREIEEIRKIGYTKEIDYQLKLVEFWLYDGNLDTVRSRLTYIEKCAEKSGISLPTEKIDSIKKKIGT